MRTVENILILFMIALAMNSCVKTDQEFYVDEEGSGKVQIEATMASGNQLNMKGNGQDEANRKEDRRKMVKKVQKIINKSKGVEAWKDVNYELNEDGEIVFEGTAYFNDITEVKIEEIIYLKVEDYNEDHIRWGGLDADAMQSEKANNFSRGKSGPDKTGDEEPKSLTNEEVEEKIDEIQKQYKKYKSMMSMVFQMFDYEATFHLPYKIKSTVNMKEGEKRAVKGTLDGDKILKASDKVMEDEEKLRELIKEKGVREFSFKDPRLKKAINPNENFMKASFRTGLFAGTDNPLDYEEEVSAIDNKFPEITMP